MIIKEKNKTESRLYLKKELDFFVSIKQIPVRIAKSRPCHKEWISVQQKARIISSVKSCFSKKGCILQNFLLLALERLSHHERSFLLHFL